MDGVLPGGEGSAVIVVALFRHLSALENGSNGGEPDYVVSRAWLCGLVPRLHTFLYHGTEPVFPSVPLTRKLRQSRAYIYVNICTCPYIQVPRNRLVNAVVAKLSKADRTPQQSRGSQEWLRLRSRCSRWGLATPYSYMQRRRKATSSLNWPGEW